MTIAEWQTTALKLLSNSPSVQLDISVLLSFVLNRPKSWVIAHSDEKLTREQLSMLDKLIQKRLESTPIAYLTGVKEFYGRSFAVSPHVLIPRPETEDLVEMLLSHAPNGQILDVGTGRGCVGITLALETNLEVTLSDISSDALGVARENAQRLGLSDIDTIESDLLEYWLKNGRVKFDIIVANLPYVDPEWDTSPETTYEPSLALYTDDGGLELIYKLIQQSISVLRSGGYLLIEADPVQHESITHAANSNYKLIDSRGYGLLYQRK